MKPVTPITPMAGQPDTTKDKSITQKINEPMKAAFQKKFFPGSIHLAKRVLMHIALLLYYNPVALEIYKANCELLILN